MHSTKTVQHKANEESICPAVLLVACADGQVMAWDFTDMSYKPSLPLKATQARITSMQYLLDENRSRQQLLAVGDETGTLHIFELPRLLHRAVHSEEAVMDKFLERELQRQFHRQEFSRSSDGAESGSAAAASNGRGRFIWSGCAAGGGELHR